MLAFNAIYDELIPNQWLSEYCVYSLDLSTIILHFTYTSSLNVIVITSHNRNASRQKWESTSVKRPLVCELVAHLCGQWQSLVQDAQKSIDLRLFVNTVNFYQIMSITDVAPNRRSSNVYKNHLQGDCPFHIPYSARHLHNVLSNLDHINNHACKIRKYTNQAPLGTITGFLENSE